MIGHYRISERAKSDLEKIWLYTFNKWSLEQADRYHNLIINEIEFIVHNFKLCRKLDYIRPGYKISKVKSHIIFFKKAEDDKIEVIRILHQNMNIEDRLKDSE